MQTSLSVVIPAYNEEINVAQCIRNVARILKATDWDWEMLVVNDGSKDKTSDVAKREIKKLKLTRARVLDNNPNRGYGGALKRGFYEATKEFVAFVPADNQFDFSEIHEFVQKQNATGADIVSGVRPSGGHDPLHRLIVRWAWNTGIRGLFGFIASDVDCGFKLFRRSILERLHLPSDGAMIDTQMLAGARARGMKIEEIEVRHLPRTAGTPTGGNIRVWVKAWRELAIFWWHLRHEILVEKGKAVFRWEFLIIAAIVIIGLGLRLYKIDQYLVFLGDEGRDALIVRDIILGRNFTIVGPGTSIGNMYLGPWYYYLMILPLAAFGLSPVGPAVMVALLGTATIALVWWVGRQWFGRVAALAVSALYAVAPTVIIFARASWNPNVMPFFALVAMYGIWKVWRLGYWRWLIIAAIAFGFVLNSHYLGLLLVPAMGLFWLLAKKDRSAWKYTILAVLVILVMMAPLVIFDARHEWFNLKAMQEFFGNRQTTVNLKAYKAIPNLWPLWQQIVTSLVAGRNAAAGMWVAASIAATTVVALFANRNRKDLLFVVTWVFTGLVGLGLYKQHIYDHYFGFLFPALFLLLGFGFQVLGKSIVGKVVAVAAFCGLLFVNLADSPVRWAPNNQLAHTQQIADFVKQESGGEDFNFALIAKSNYDASYRYMLAMNDAKFKTVHERITNQLFVACEIPDCQPIGNPLWEIASFGWAKIDREWEFPWGVKLYKLVPNPSGKSQ